MSHNTLSEDFTYMKIIEINLSHLFVSTLPPKDYMQLS